MPRRLRLTHQAQLQRPHSSSPNFNRRSLLATVRDRDIDYHAIPPTLPRRLPPEQQQLLSGCHLHMVDFDWAFRLTSFGISFMGDTRFEEDESD